MSQSLLSFDTDRIKEYVFATGKLAEIRGSSALLDRLNREEMPRLVDPSGNNTIYANGGSGLFIVPTEQAQTLIQAVQKQYQSVTKAATITGVRLELPPGFDKESDLPPYWQKLGFKLRMAKDCNPVQADIISHPFLLPCQSCGIYYATDPYVESGEQTTLLCQSCYLKHREDHQIKDEIPEVATGEIKPNQNRLWHRLIDDLKKQDNFFDRWFRKMGDSEIRPKDLDILGEQSSPSGYLGFIYADGDDMGRHLEQIPSLNKMEQFSKGVDQAIYGAVKRAILTHLKPAHEAQSLPFDILLLGGDDLIMVTTAQTAIETALTVLKQFPDLTKQNCGQSLSLSVAVVLAHVKFPISLLQELAQSTLKFAKSERAKRGLNEGILNFLIVSSANHLDFKAHYKATLTKEDLSRGEITYRTMRPYAASDMDKLIKTRHALAGASRSKLAQLRTAIFKSRCHAQLDGLVAWTRWRNQTHRDKIWELLQDFNQQRKPLLFPWVQKEQDSQNTYVTPLLDLIELFDFISEGGNGNDSN